MTEKPRVTIYFDPELGRLVQDPPDPDEVIDLTIFGEPVRLTRRTVELLQEIVEKRDNGHSN